MTNEQQNVVDYFYKLVESKLCPNKLASLVMLANFLDLPKPVLVTNEEKYVKLYGRTAYNIRLEKALLAMLREFIGDPNFGEGPW